MSQQFGLGRGLSSLIPQNMQSDTAHERAQASAVIKDDANTKVLERVVEEVEGSQAPQRKNHKTQDATKEAGDDTHRTIAVNAIVPNPHQPRLTFNKIALAELAESIKEHGILQPIIVSPREGGYEIIAGERRFRAAQIAGLIEVSVIVREATERQKMELALIENVQRHDLDLIEEARAYQQLAQTYGLSQEDVAKRVGKSRSAVANRMRLLGLPVSILKMVSEGIISEGHAKILLSLNTTQEQHALCDLVVREHLSVRQTEARAKKAMGTGMVSKATKKAALLPAVAAAQQTLATALDTRVTIAQRGRGGKVMIDYYAPEDLHTLVGKLQTQE